MIEQKQYTIQEIRNMLVEMADQMNPYKHIDAANGIKVVHQFLESVQARDEQNKEQI